MLRNSNTNTGANSNVAAAVAAAPRVFSVGVSDNKKQDRKARTLEQRRDARKGVLLGTKSSKARRHGQQKGDSKSLKAQKGDSKSSKARRANIDRARNSPLPVARNLPFITGRNMSNATLSTDEMAALVDCLQSLSASNQANSGFAVATESNVTKIVGRIQAMNASLSDQESLLLRLRGRGKRFVPNKRIEIWLAKEEDRYAAQAFYEEHLLYIQHKNSCDDEAKAKLQHSSNTKIMKQKDIYDAMSCIDHMPISSCNNRRSVIFRLVYAIDVMVMYAFCRLTNTTRIQRSTHHQHYS
eukprot:scaffold737_cov127-Skeletonema_marinoi.AAC.2